MINKSVLIAILARDCNQAIIKNIPNIERLRREFKESRVVIIENDSKDGTKETLKRWEKESIGVEAIMNDYGTITIPELSKDVKNPSASMYRISKMAKYRNLYMDYARNADFHIDYLIVIDIDIEDFSIKGIVDAIKNAPDDWGGVFANGQSKLFGNIRKYYDLFAYVPYESENYSLTYREIIDSFKKLKKDLKSHSFVKCKSAFGGIAIYKWQFISSFRYIAIKNERSKWFEALCEHIPFNKGLLDYGLQNYICSRMNVSYGKCSFKEYFLFSIIPTSLFFYLFKLLNSKVSE